MKFPKILTTIVALILLASVNITRAADTTPIAPEKLAEIKRMLQLTGMENMMDQMMGQMMDIMRQSATDLPPEFFTKFVEKAKAKSLIDKVIPLYDKYYTLEDLRAINAFYNSPAGKKVTASLPQIMQESMALGQKWGEELGVETMLEVMKEKNAPKAAE